MAIRSLDECNQNEQKKIIEWFITPYQEGFSQMTQLYESAIPATKEIF
jgi:hypothetical protein